MELETSASTGQGLRNQTFIGQLKLESTSEHRNNESRPVCDVCQVFGKPTRCICLECEEFLCTDCETAHRGSKATRMHPINPVDEVYRRHQGNLEESLKQVLAMKQEVERKRMHNQEAINTCQEKQTGLVKRVNAIREALKAKIDRHHDAVIEELRRLHREQISTLERREEGFERDRNKLDESVQILSNALQSQDLLWSIETVKGLREEVEQELSQMALHLVDCDDELNVSVDIEAGEDWDPVKSTKVKAEEKKNTQEEMEQLRREEDGMVGAVEQAVSKVDDGRIEQPAEEENNDVGPSGGGQMQDPQFELNNDVLPSTESTQEPVVDIPDLIQLGSPRDTNKDTNREEGPPVEQGDAEERGQECPVCSQVFNCLTTTEEQFSEHVESHFANTKGCPMCGKKFSSDTSNMVYEQHVNSHFVADLTLEDLL